MEVDWADPLSQPGAMAGLGCAQYGVGMGSWLSDLIKRNKNTISKIVAPIVGSVATVVTAGGAAPIIGGVLSVGSSLLSTLGDPKSMPAAATTTTTPAATTQQQSSAVPLLVGGGLLALLLSRK